VQRKHITGITAGHTLSLIIVSSIYMGASNTTQAAEEKKSYTKPPFSPFTSQQAHGGYPFFGIAITIGLQTPAGDENA
jgi:hypothetical protein